MTLHFQEQSIENQKELAKMGAKFYREFARSNFPGISDADYAKEKVKLFINTIATLGGDNSIRLFKEVDYLAFANGMDRVTYMGNVEAGGIGLEWHPEVSLAEWELKEFKE